MPTAIHVRDHRSLLATAEKRLLIRIAGALPRSIHSDHLTALALASMFVAGAAFAAMRVWPGAAVVVIVALAANWFGDSLDGTLARVRGHQRPRFGFYVDHAIDLLGTLALFVGIACSGLMAPAIAMGVLAAYLLVCAESFLATHATGVFRMSAWGVGPTELRLLLAAGAAYAARGVSAHVPIVGEMKLFDIGGAVAVVGLVTVCVVAFVRQTRLLSRLEPRIVATILIVVLALPLRGMTGI
jgi:archaetidylinositol phosphate synthase